MAEWVTAWQSVTSLTSLSSQQIDCKLAPPNSHVRMLIIIRGGFLVKLHHFWSSFSQYVSSRCGVCGLNGALRNAPLFLQSRSTYSKWRWRVRAALVQSTGFSEKFRVTMHKCNWFHPVAHYIWCNLPRVLCSVLCTKVLMWVCISFSTDQSSFIKGHDILHSSISIYCARQCKHWV